MYHKMSHQSPNKDTFFNSDGRHKEKRWNGDEATKILSSLTFNKLFYKIYLLQP